jgi:hypothetical protein
VLAGQPCDVGHAEICRELIGGAGGRFPNHPSFGQVARSAPLDTAGSAGAAAAQPAGVGRQLAFLQAQLDGGAGDRAQRAVGVGAPGLVAGPSAGHIRLILGLRWNERNH